MRKKVSRIKLIATMFSDNTIVRLPIGKLQRFITTKRQPIIIAACSMMLTAPSTWSWNCRGFAAAQITTSGLAYWVTKVISENSMVKENSVGNHSCQPDGMAVLFHAATNGPLTIKPVAIIIPKCGGLNPADTLTSIPKIVCQVKSAMPEIPKINTPKAESRYPLGIDLFNDIPGRRALTVATLR